MLVLDNSNRKWKHHSCGVFTNPIKKTSFEFDEEDGTVSADILQIDARFVSLIKWLGENHINVRLSGENRADGYAVYKIREIAFGGATKLSAEDGFLQFMIERLFASSAPTEEAVDALDEIRVTGKGCLRFALRDGRVEERQWAWESRAKAWTPEMRRKASEQMKRRWRHD